MKLLTGRWDARPPLPSPHRSIVTTIPLYLAVCEATYARTLPGAYCYFSYFMGKETKAQSSDLLENMLLGSKPKCA